MGAVTEATKKTAERYEAILAEQVTTLNNEKATELAAKEAEIAAKEAKIERLEDRLRPVDENGILADRMAEFYGRAAPGEEPEFATDEEFRGYCRENHPEAVYPSNEWTAEEVIATWLEKPEIWGNYADSEIRNNAWFTWTPDYQYCFILDSEEPMFFLTDHDTGEHEELISGWLTVNGVRVAMLDKETYDIEDPYELIRQYQAGEWDGSIRRSHDGSTTVKVRAYGDGYLEYDSEIWLYDERFDPEGMAWTEFVRVPWWAQEGVAPEILEIIGWDGAPSGEPWEKVNVKGTAGLNLKMYVDLPVGYDMSGVTVFKRLKSGLLCAESDKIVLYKNGELVDEWDFRFTEDRATFYSPIEGAPEEYADDLAYIYDKSADKLIALRNGGETEVVLDRTVKDDWSVAELWGYKGDQLMCWKLSTYYWSDGVSNLGEVAEVDTSSSVLLFTKKDGGCYTAVWNGSASVDPYRVQYLGSESLEYYRELYKLMRSGKDIRYPG